MADKVADLPHMTIEVYRLNAETGERTIVKPLRVVEAGEVLMTAEYPPCQCYLCRSKRDR